MPIFPLQANIAGFSLEFCWHVLQNSKEFSIASEAFFGIASDLGVCDSNRIAHRSGIAFFVPELSPRPTHVRSPENQFQAGLRFADIMEQSDSVFDEACRFPPTTYEC